MSVIGSPTLYIVIMMILILDIIIMIVMIIVIVILIVMEVNTMVAKGRHTLKIVLLCKFYV